MAQKYLALDWDHNQLHLVAASVSSGGVQFTRALVLDEDITPGVGNAEEIGKRLQARLKEFNIPAAPVLACIGRERLIVKEVRFPAVPLHEEPNIVRFQTVKELTESADDVVIDYTTLPSAPGEGERRAQSFVAKREFVRTWQTICQTAGLKLAGLTPRSHGLTACLGSLLGTGPQVPPPDPADAPVAIVAVGEKWAEFAILKNGSLAQSRTLAIGPGLAGEIRRNLAVYSGQHTQAPVKAVYLALSGEQAALRTKLAESLEIPVHPFDPFGAAEGKNLPSSGRGTFAGAGGLLHLLTKAKALPINFAQAKQIKPPKDPNQRVYGLVAAAVLLLLVGGLFAGRVVVSTLQDDLAGKERELADLNRQLEQEKKSRESLQDLHEWEGVPVPDEIFEVSVHMPPITNDFRARKLVVTNTRDGMNTDKKQTGKGPQAGKQTGAPKPEELNARPAARIELTFPTTSRKTLDTLDDNLLSGGSDKGGGFYRPNAPVQTNARSPLTKTIDVRQRTPDEYKFKAPDR